MTHRTVPLDLLVRVQSIANEMHIVAHSLCDPTRKAVDVWAHDLLELTAQIEQQREGEPVAWQYFDAGQWWPTNSSSFAKYPSHIPTRALYTAPPATPQDSVPAWATKQAFCEWWNSPEDEQEIWSELESRALALAQPQSPKIEFTDDVNNGKFGIKVTQPTKEPT